MPSQDFIDVRITSNGEPLVEYLDPEGNSDNERFLTRYVEARTDQTFAVKVTCLPGFNLEFAPGLRVAVSVDGAPFLRKIVHKALIQHRRGVLGEKKEVILEYVKYKNDTTRHWEKFPYKFGALGRSEDSTLPGIEPEKLQGIGTIRVRVFRANEVKLEVPRVRDGHMPRVLDEIPEKMLKGIDIKNIVKYENGTIGHDPGLKKYNWPPMPGTAGRQYEFTFVYRSRKILQSIGCIPRSPSPPPDPNLALERTEDMLKLAKRQQREERLENMRLRALLAEASSSSRSNSYLEGGSTTATTMDQSPRTPATSQDPSVKREFDYQMVDLTGNIIKQEPALRSIESSSAPIKRQYSTTSNNPTPLNAPIQRHRPTPPLFDSTTHQGKRKREEWDEEDALVGMPPAPRRPNVVIDLTDE